MALVTATLSCTATGVAKKVTLPQLIKIATGTGTATTKRDALQKLNVTIVTIPSKLMAITRVMPLVISTTVPKVLRMPGRSLLTTRVLTPVVGLLRSGAAPWDEIEASRKWSMMDVAKWSIDTVQRFLYSSAMKGR